MVIGITVTLSQLYAQLGEFSWHLLVLRLGETAIGVGAVLVTVLLVLPLRPQRVLTAGVLLWFRSLSEMMNASLDRLLDHDHRSPRPEIRDMDAAYAALEAAAAPLRRGTFGRNSAQLTEIRSVSSAARNYARSFAVCAQQAHLPDTAQMETAVEQLRASMAAIEHRISTGDHDTYTRSASLVERAMRGVPADDSRTMLALSDLQLFDGALARLATALQMAVVDYDTNRGDAANAADAADVAAP